MSSSVAWALIFIAGILEIVWAVGFKETQGFTRFWPSVISITAMVISMALLAFSLKVLPVGTAYAVWTGIGAAGTAIIGILFLGESSHFLRIICIGLIAIGIIGLKFFSQSL